MRIFARQFSIVSLLFIFMVMSEMLPYSALAEQQRTSFFEGELVMVLLSEVGPDRSMRVRERFAFVDGNGRRWEVPAGAVVNGASIPEFLWALFGPPFVGDYRRASVLHDYYYNLVDSLEVDRMFFEAAIVDGLDEQKAKIMYSSIRLMRRFENLRSMPLEAYSRLRLEFFRYLQGRPADTFYDTELLRQFEFAQRDLIELIESEDPDLERIDDIVGF